MAPGCGGLPGRIPGGKRPIADHGGQLGTCVPIVDDQFRWPEIHASTIGILLCTGKTGPTVRYALAGTRVPIAVADYQGLPEDARGVLPSAAELEAVIEDELDHRTDG